MKKPLLCLLCFYILFLPLFPIPAVRAGEQAAQKAESAAAKTAAPQDDVPELSARAAVLMDAATGTVLYAKNPDEQIPPASLTKLMTMHVALTKSESKNIPLDAVAVLPPESWAKNQPPRSSIMGLDKGQIVNFKELFLGLAIPSGNDAAVAVALNFAPSIEDFALLMNNEAAKMGLKRTVFVEPSGISEKNLTTALDFAKFCRIYLYLHPQVIKEYHSVQEFTYPKRENIPQNQAKYPAPVKYYHHIRLLNSYEGADGLKTGYIDESGYNLAITAERDGTRLIAVILGVPAKLGSYWGARKRDADGKALLNWGFEHFKTLKIPYPELAPARVWKGKENYTGVAPAPDTPISGTYISGASNEAAPEKYAEFTLPKDRGLNVYYEIKMNEDLIAPVPEGAQAGAIVFFDDKSEIGSVPLLTAAPVEEGNFFKRLWDSIVMFFSGIQKAPPA